MKLHVVFSVPISQEETSSQISLSDSERVALRLNSVVPISHEETSPQSFLSHWEWVALELEDLDFFDWAANRCVLEWGISFHCISQRDFFSEFSVSLGTGGLTTRWSRLFEWDINSYNRCVRILELKFYIMFSAPISHEETSSQSFLSH